ncbi:hypothetical protein D3C72_1137340 [compost metagenome]
MVVADEQAHQTVQGHLPIVAIAGAPRPGTGGQRLEPVHCLQAGGAKAVQLHRGILQRVLVVSRQLIAIEGGQRGQALFQGTAKAHLVAQGLYVQQVAEVPPGAEALGWGPGPVGGFPVQLVGGHLCQQSFELVRHGQQRGEDRHPCLPVPLFMAAR